MAESSTGRLLIVDDEVLQMRALCETLREHRYEAVGVNTGEEALEVLRTEKFDLLLTDLMMPGIDGVGLLRSALAIDPELVGIIMTGQGSIASAVDAMKEGALDYILKPFKVSVLLAVIGRALAMRQLRRENALLQCRVAERTAELEAANESLDAFAASVAHDLRTPARHIVGYAELVLREHGAELKPDAARYLQTIARAGASMGRLIDDVLMFSRISRTELNRRPVDLGALAQRVWRELELQREAFTPDAAPRIVNCRFGELPTVLGDEAMLRQVLVNLLSNAVKYTRGKTPAEIEVASAGRDAHGVTVFVRDNGVGFDMKHAARLFGMFQRLHSPRDFEGNGVGLANVRRIVERHGGRVWAQSEPGQGATFFVQLPEPPSAEIDE